MTTNWRALVDPTLEAVKRSCIFCGGVPGGVYKTVSVDDVHALLDVQDKHLRCETMHCTYHNLCMSLSAMPVAGVGLMQERFVACSCCHHWVAKRSKSSSFFFPLQALRYHLHSMPYIDGKQLDTRVIHRLSTALVTGHSANFFNTLLSDDERAVCRQIAAAKVPDVTPLVAAHIHAQNANAIFMRNARLTELVREGL